MKRKLLIPVVLVAGAAIALAIHHSRSTSAGDPNKLFVSGNIEITDAQLGFKIAGRVEKRLVDEGQRVQKGQVVALLDATDLKIEVDIRQAELVATQAALAELTAGSRAEEIAAARALVQAAEAGLLALQRGSRPQEIAAAEARVSAAQAERDRLETDTRRGEELFKSKTISSREYDQIRRGFEAANARLKETQDQLALVREGPRKEEIAQARAKVAQSKAQLNLVEEGPRKEDIQQAKARVQQAQATLNLAQVRLNYATLYSPLTGIVLSENIEPGEYVSPGTPVITVGDLANVWLRAYINETDLGRVRLGQAAAISTDTFPGNQYQGRLSFISPEAEFTPKNIQTEKERVKLVYRIKIDVANPNMELKPGMPADAAILLDSKKAD